LGVVGGGGGGGGGVGAARPPDRGRASKFDRQQLSRRVRPGVVVTPRCANLSCARKPLLRNPNLRMSNGDEEGRPTVAEDADAAAASSAKFCAARVPGKCQFIGP
jgi:hypothetical protein